MTRSCPRCRSARARSRPTSSTSTARPSASLAASTGVGRVLLTHLQMGFDPEETLASVRAAYDGPVEFVWPGTRLEL